MDRFELCFWKIGWRLFLHVSVSLLGYKYFFYFIFQMLAFVNCETSTFQLFKLFLLQFHYDNVNLHIYIFIKNGLWDETLRLISQDHCN